MVTKCLIAVPVDYWDRQTWKPDCDGMPQHDCNFVLHQIIYTIKLVRVYSFFYFFDEQMYFIRKMLDLKRQLIVYRISRC